MATTQTSLWFQSKLLALRTHAVMAHHVIAESSCHCALHMNSVHACLSPAGCLWMLEYGAALAAGCEAQPLCALLGRCSRLGSWKELQHNLELSLAVICWVIA